jgi:serine phosphatase RsbU (regulator of sigma subunit)
MDDSQRRIRSLTAELLNVYEELALLYSLTAQIGRLTTEESIVTAALTEAIQVVPANLGWVVSWRNGRPAVVSQVGDVPAGADLKSIADKVLGPLRARSRSSLLLHDTPAESAGGADHFRLLACSVSSGRTPETYLCLLRSADTPIFTSGDQKLISAVTAVAAIGIENVRLHRSEIERLRLEHELDLARTIQRSLLPHDFSGCRFLEAAGESEPCLQIGGDYYDLAPIDEAQCLCIIADVSGKGPAAALKAAMVQGNVQALCRTPIDPAAFMLTLNDCFRSRTAKACNFVTAFAGVLDRSGLFRYSNAGHNPPLLVRPNGAIRELKEGGPLLGFFAQPKFEEASVQLSPGDLLILYTDGVTECEDEDGQFFGPERLMSWAATHAAASPEVLRQDLLATIRSFAGNRPQPDDLTFLVLRYTGE